MIAQAQEILARLISFRPVSSDTNLPLIQFCRDWLSANHIDSTVVPAAEGNKASLYATIGPKVPGGIVLSGHTDVVPVAGQAWATDPWGLTESHGKLFGRGTSDMLGFVALVLAAAPMFRDAGLRRPIHIALSYDEEVGCKGGRILVETMARALPAPVAVIVGEPTGNELVNGHKAYLQLSTLVRGRAVHSSRPDLGASALAAAARLVCWLDDVQYSNMSDPSLHDDRFDPPYTTLHCGVLEGGTSPTAVADRATFSADIRTVPYEDPHIYLQRFSGFAAELETRSLAPDGPRCSVEIEVVTDIPGLYPEENSTAESFMQSVGLPCIGKTFPGGTEAGLFQQAGWSTILFGPGDLIRAHKADEYIKIVELAESLRILQRIASRMAGE